MSGRLEGKTAVVTGSTKGIGLGIARAYVREGARVVINSRSAEDCAGIVRELGSAAVAVPADLSCSEEVRRLAAEALAALGRVDILVNNAGQPRVAPSESLPEADYRYTLDLNLNGCFVLTQEIVQGMLAAGRGCIIHVSSMNGSVPFPQRLAYCVSKAGLNMMTKVMAIEWAARGVRVNAIAPGYVQTEFITMLSARGVLDAERLARRTPMGRIGTPEEIGEVAVFLASPAASYITGEILTVDGGWSSYGYL
ncbi:MAG TPA: glucose 1-dehydrogenase [Methylomirabilota bacterium]|jgi:NAD(P)-dependent dehydrogenase (short-subunit alcohol dehydrogenase family)|nr:glucose 1-dehydrogenase [Methylomirabilota bacterium]